MNSDKRLKRLNVGDELPTRTMKITQEGISSFHEASGGSNPVHTDADLALARGFGAPVQHGIRTMYPLFSMLMDYYPKGMLLHGKMEAKFIATVEPGALMTCHCRVKEKQRIGDQDWLIFETWAENDKGMKALVGKATVPERPSSQPY